MIGITPTPMFNKFEKIEHELTKSSIKPIVGFAFGLAKAMVGIAETISAIALSTFFLAAACFAPEQKVMLQHASFSARHIVKGLKNIGYGLLEAIPGLGSKIAIHQLHHTPGNLVIDAKPQTLEIGKGYMIKNPDLKIVNLPCTRCFTLRMQTEPAAMTFANVDALKAAIKQEVTAQVQACPNKVPVQARVEILDDQPVVDIEAQEKCIEAIATDLTEHIASITQESPTLRLAERRSSNEDFYCYEVTGILKRYFIEGDDSLRVKFTINLGAAIIGGKK